MGTDLEQARSAWPSNIFELAGKQNAEKNGLLTLAAVMALMTGSVWRQTSQVQATVALAKALELDTPYVPPPGETIEQYASGFAKIMCSAVLVTGLDPDFAAESVGYFTAPYAERAKRGVPKLHPAVPSA